MHQPDRGIALEYGVHACYHKHTNDTGETVFSGDLCQHRQYFQAPATEGKLIVALPGAVPATVSYSGTKKSEPLLTAKC